jgi:hypothetical protein
MKLYYLPPLYGVGGTAVGGYEPLPLVEAPYLPGITESRKYTLVLDLDETLVHYYEVNYIFLLNLFRLRLRAIF